MARRIAIVRRTVLNWRWIVGLAALLLLVILAVQNHGAVPVKFLFWTFNISRAIVIFIAFAGGFLTAGAVLLYKQR